MILSNETKPTSEKQPFSEPSTLIHVIQTNSTCKEWEIMGGYNLILLVTWGSSSLVSSTAVSNSWVRFVTWHRAHHFQVEAKQFWVLISAATFHPSCLVGIKCFAILTNICLLDLSSFSYITVIILKPHTKDILLNKSM